MSTAQRTYKVKLHTAGEGPLPLLNTNVLRELNTQNGVLTQNRLLDLFLRTVVFVEREDGGFSADLTLPAKPNKLANLKEKAATFWREGRRWDEEDARWEWPKGNTYHIVGAHEEIPSLTVRVYERFTATPPGVADAKRFRERTSASFLQAVLKTYAYLPELDAAPDILWMPVTKQACEQFLSNVRLRAGEEQEAGIPDTSSRDPVEREREWLANATKLAMNADGFQYELEEKETAKGKKRKRWKNVSPDWGAFVRSPFPRRLPIKIEPDYFSLYLRRWEGDGRNSLRVYLALRVFAGVSQESVLGRLQSARNGKLFWWHRHIREFTPLPLWDELTANRETILIPLEVLADEKFLSGFSKGRKSCLLTLTEVRLWNRDRQRKSYSGSRHHSSKRLEAPPFAFFAHIVTSEEVAEPALPALVLGIHFSDRGVFWSLGNREGTELTSGCIEGMAPLETGLLEKTRLEAHQGKLRWVGGRKFRPQINERTLTLVHIIFLLADLVEWLYEEDVGFGVEDIQWVDKHSRGPDANRRFSMFNYAALLKRILFFANDIATRAPDGKPRFVIDRPWSYWSEFTCPKCGACRKSKQLAGNEDTYLLREKERTVLHCRRCYYRGEVSPQEKACTVMRRTASRLRWLFAKGAEA